MKPRHESAKTPFRNDLLARGLLPNQLRYRQLQLYRSAKRVETETVITHVALWRGQRQNQDKLKDGQKMGKSTCAIVRSVGNITGSFQCRLCTRPSPVTGTGLSNTCADRWRGQVQNIDLLDRHDSGQIRGKTLKLSALQDLSHDINLPRPPFETTSWQETDYSIN